MTRALVPRLARVLLALAALLHGALAHARTPALLPLQKVADNVWFVQGEAALGSAANRNFISNAGFIVTQAGVVVVDALGSPAVAYDLLATIRSVTDRPVRYVVVTHYHADHVYGLQVFKAHGAEVLARREAREYLHSDAAQQRLAMSRKEFAPSVDDRTVLVAADRWLDEDTTLELGNERIRIKHAGPAHTSEDLVVFAERSRVLFAGDLVFKGRIPFVGTADSRAWIRALGELIALKPAVIVPGHGPSSNDPLGDLTLTRDYLQFLRTSMAAAAANLEPFEDAYARTDWSAYEKLPLFGAANRINAYNTYLLMEQQHGR